MNLTKREVIILISATLGAMLGNVIANILSPHVQHLLGTVTK